MQNDTLVAVDISKEIFEIGVSDRRAAWRAGADCGAASSWSSSLNYQRRQL